MNKFLLGILTSIVAMYLILRLKIYIDINYHRRSQDDNLTIKVRLLPHVIIYTLEVPIMQIEDEKDIAWVTSELETPHGKTETNVRREKNFVKNLANIFWWHPQRWRKITRQFNNYSKIYSLLADKLLSKISCEYFFWDTTYGSEDAAVTGLSVGTFWLLKTTVLLKMQQRLQFTGRPRLQVSPAFGRSRFEVDLQCIFSIRLGNVIKATMDAVNFSRKGAIGGG